MNSVKKAAAGALALALSATVLAETVKVDPALPAYKRASGVSGNLNSIGSDTLNNLMTYWAEGFKKAYPNVNIQIEGKGSSTAPPALTEGTAQLGPMSREMTGSEKDKFEAKYKYKPTQIRVALDGIAIYVNKDNPIKELTFKQIDGIFSTTRKRGGKDIKTWGTSASPASGPPSRSRSSGATGPPAPTATSRSTRSTRATTRTASRSSRAPRPSSRASPRTSTRSATPASATRRPA